MFSLDHLIKAILMSIYTHISMLCVLIRSPHQGDSNEYTQHTIFNIKRNPKSAFMGLFSKGLKNEFQTAVLISVRATEVLLYVAVF